MTNIKLIIIVFMISSLSVAGQTSNESFTPQTPTVNTVAGVSVGYGRSLYDADYEMSHPNYDKGQGQHTKYSIWADTKFSGTDMNYLYGAFSFGYTINSGSIDVLEERLPILDPNGNVQYMVTYNRMDIKNNYVDASIGVGYRMSEVSLDASFLAGFRSYAATTTSLSLVSPDNAKFDSTKYPPDVEYEDDGRTMITDRKETSVHTTPLFGVQIAARYTVRSGSFVVHVVPYYRYYFNSIYTDSKATLSIVALDIRIGITL